MSRPGRHSLTRPPVSMFAVYPAPSAVARNVSPAACAVSGRASPWFTASATVLALR
jgi:hypothetical protein